MSEEDLELLITLDDPEGAPEEDTFNHLPAENSLEYWLDQPHSKGTARLRAEANRKNEVWKYRHLYFRSVCLSRIEDSDHEMLFAFI